MNANKFPKNRRIITPEMRQIIINHSESGLNDASIGQMLSLPRTTVATITKRYFRTGEKINKSRGGDRRSKLSTEHKEFLNSTIDNDPTMTLKCLVQKLQDEFQLTVGKSTVHRCIEAFHYTLKNVVPVPEVRNCQTTITKRLDYSTNFNKKVLEVEDKNLIFVDEVGFCVSSRTKRGRSIVGTSPYVPVIATRTRNISVIAAMNKYGMIHHKVKGFIIF